MPVFLKWGDMPWVEIFDFGFGAASPVSLAAGGFAQSGRPEFEDVTVNLTGDLLAPGFFAGMAAGTVADAVIRTSEIPTGGGDPANHIVHEIHLGRAALSRFQDNRRDGLFLAFAPEEIRINRFEADNVGTLQPKGSFEWDIATNDPVTEAITTPPPLAGIANDGVVQNFFMAIDGLGGSLLRGANKGWFALSDVDLGLDRAVLPGPGGPDLGNLVSNGFRVTLADQTALTALLALVANGRLLRSVEIEGRSDADVLRSETRFGAVSVVSVTEDAGNGYEVEFRFEQISTQTFGTDGKPGAAPNLTAFDLVTQSAEAVTIPAPVPVGALETSAAIRYMLAIGGLRGDSVIAGHEKWFDLDQFDFALSAFGGVPQAQDLAVQLSTDTGLARMMALIAAGTELPGATISGVDGLGSVVYTLDLGSVRLSGLVDRFDGGVELLLNYGQVELTSRGVDGLGQLRPNPVFGWDFETNSALGNALASASPAAGGRSATPVPPQKYYMLVDGMTGGSAAPGRAGWFELDNFDFSAFSQGGAPNFSALSVSTVGDQGLSAMFRAAALGQVLAGLRIEGVVTVGGEERRVTQLTLSDAVVESLTDSGRPGYEMAFGYERFTLRTFDGFTGKLSGESGWDLVTNEAFTGSPRIAASRGLAEAQADRYVLALSDIPGDGVTEGFDGSSAIVDFAFGLSRPTSPGGPQGPLSFDTLSVQFATDTLLPDLLARMTQEKTIEVATLFGLKETGNEVRLGIDLGEVRVTSVTDLAGAGFVAELAFAQIETQQRRYDPARDRLGAENSFGWDLVTGQTTTVPNAPREATPIKAVIAPTGHVLAIAGLNGDLTGPLRGGWLAVEDMSFGADNPAFFKEDGTGLESGKTTFQPLSLVLASDRGLTEMLEAMASGTPLTELRIDGTIQRTTPGGGIVETVVQAYDMGEVYVTGVFDRAGPGYSVTLEAARFRLTHYKADGTEAQVAEWDAETSTPGGPSRTVGPGGSSGADRLVGSLNNSTIDGLAGNDTIDGGFGNDRLFGGADNDRLFGKAGNDFLDGGTGVDILVGGAGADTLQGGANRDFFEFERFADSTPAAADTILDFRFGPDQIDLRAVSAAEMTFVGTAAFTATDQVRVAASGASSIVLVNLFGDTAPEMEIRITNLSAGNFTAGDFLL